MANCAPALMLEADGNHSCNTTTRKRLFINVMQNSGVKLVYLRYLMFVSLKSSRFAVQLMVFGCDVWWQPAGA